MAESEKQAVPFVWDGKELSTIGDLMDAMSAIFAASDEAKAAEFMAEYRKVNTHADENVGYLTGYFSFADMPKVQKLFRANHPIFGGPEQSVTITAEQAFAMGEQKGGA